MRVPPLFPMISQGKVIIIDMLKKIFKKKQNIVIGVLHLPPLLGYPNFPGFKVALSNALKDLEAFEKGGVDALFLENNYGLSPENVTTPVATSMGYLIGEIRQKTRLPLGVSVLWNDYKTAFALAKVYNLQFIRVPVFVDKVESYCGVITGDPKKVLHIRNEFNAQKVVILTDIHVKHAKLLSKMDLVTSAKKAVKEGSDAIIMTGNWTAESPALADLKKVRKAVTNFPIFVGSGADVNNVRELCSVANGVIVSTSLKKGGAKKGERNVKKYTQRVDQKRILAFTRKLKGQ